MGDGDSRYVSKPPVKADLNVLCVDGTRPTDSAAFFNYLESAGKRIKNREDRVVIQNLLSLIGSEMGGAIKAPTRADEKVFPFGAERMKTLPIKKTSLPGSRQRIAHVLLPQGEVTGSKTDFSDPALGSTKEERRTAAELNSKLLMRLCLAPGVSNAGTASAQFDFATGGNTSTDILYLSGHGSMAGAVCGEADDYMKYFELLLLVTEEFLGLAGANLVPPMWMVTGACFSMRPAHAEIWLRFFDKQRVPLRGILGYQTTSPLADASAEINRRFANALAEGMTFIQAWQKANGSNDAWTALAFQHATNDTLTSLRNLKRGTAGSDVPAPKDRQLFFHQQGSPPHAVRIEPPVALLEVHHWEGGMLLMMDPGVPPQPFATWSKRLITNLDFTEEKFKAEAEKSDGKYVSNDSWKACFGGKRLIDLGSSWDHRFCGRHFYAVVFFPPFTEPFTNGFQPGDHFELSVVHVRQTYPKAVNLVSIFELLRINGQPYREVKHDIPSPSGARDKQSGRVRNRIRFACPAGNSGFEPARIVVRYKKEAAAQQYLWFWFAVKIERAGKTIFEHNFDNFIMTTSQHGCEPLDPRDPTPEGDDTDVWTAPVQKEHP